MIEYLKVENTKKSLLFWSSFAILLSTAFLFILINNKELYFILAKENANAELLTALFYFIAGILLIIFVYKKSVQKNPAISKTAFIFPLCFALFFIFIAGEEESWGQWLFNYQVPDSIKDTNYQEEINVHNLNFFLTSLITPHFILNLFAVVCGIILPVFYNFSDVARNLLNKLHFPVCPLLCGTFIVCGILNEQVGNIILEHWSHCEIKEFIFSIAFFLFSISVITENNKNILGSESSKPQIR